MSAPASPADLSSSPRRRERPPTLEFQGVSPAVRRTDYSPGDEDDMLAESAQTLQPSVLVSPALEDPPIDTDYPASRSASSVSLDPYYFSTQSGSDSPFPPPLPPLPRTPDNQQPYHAPVTPARDPAAIDRRGLVGVGELATPRWTRSHTSASEDRISIPEAVLEDEAYQVIDAADAEDDVPDSPWTIEAVDGEVSDKDDLPKLPPPQRPLRQRPSLADESGGEEILYPRKARVPTEPLPQRLSSPIGESSEVGPPSAYAVPTRKARKRSSEEFELDQTGMPASKSDSASTSPRDRVQDEKVFTRRHRSTNSAGGNSASVLREAAKARRRESLGLSTGTPKSSNRHSRQTSGGSSASSPHEPRRHTSDYSHLPPSPSTNSIQHILRGSGGNASPHYAHSPNVAHSLLRGTQEGWSGMDDEATAEALRKLDGISGSKARARSSIASVSRTASLSRPSSPPARSSNRESGGEGKPNRSSTSARERDLAQRQLLGLAQESLLDVEPVGTALSSDDQYAYSQEKTPKKTGTSSTRSSMQPKRGSASSTTYASTPTTSSRDSASMSATTSATSVSVASLRKNRRNSASSDVSSNHSSDATSFKDRVASLASNGEVTDDAEVPPVPPLPKDLSTYRSPPHTATGPTFSHSSATEDSHDNVGSDHLEVPSVGHTSSSEDVPSSRRQSRHYSSGYATAASASDSTPQAPKTPSKKWSFSNALSIKLSGSPSTSHKSQSFQISPRSVSFGQSRKSGEKDRANMPAVPANSWSPTHPDAMASASSLASMSSVGSVRTPAPSSKTPERSRIPSRSGTDSSASTSLAAPTGPMSPTSSVRRGQSKRLTPSSIPFFRRSSSQSMQQPPPNPTTPPPHPTGSLPPQTPSTLKKRPSSPGDHNPPSTSAHRKSSMLSLGLPSLLKGSSSRRSLHSDSKDTATKSPREADDLKREKSRTEKEKKKDDKDRSESRISALMGRKRGKTLSSADPPSRKGKSPVNLPPLHVAALEPATAQRVARLKGAPDTPPSASSSRSSIASSRLTSQTISSLQKQSDTSIRSSNTHRLPTIAGSPSVGANTSVSKESSKDGPPNTLLNSSTGMSKEAPTKIPRISSRTSATGSPNFKGSTLTARRQSSVHATTASNNPSPTLNEFGMMDSTGESSSSTKPTPSSSRIRSSPSTVTNSISSRMPRQVSGAGASASTSSILPRKNRDSVSFTGLRKSSTASVNSLGTTTDATPTASSSHHRFSALSPSKLKLLSPKISLPRSSHNSSHNIHQTMATASASSSRQSLSTPSPVPSSMDEDEILGDEEMLNYIKRQHAKKLAAGSTQAELDELLRFPEPIPPAEGLTPQAVLKGSQNQYLSEYERKEILEFPSVYYTGAHSKKKMATPDVTTNNFGYDDDRGDYQIVFHDHLAYRYEVIESVGKGSFGQVLNCRDHKTGESVAIKIIRNKKRFHHQALVEIKILDNLRKWDEEEKHHVIKMTEHFYFRGHLCIAMELLSINLYELIKANGFVGFTTALIRRFTSQMLYALSLMRHHRIVHCDLKPENVLLRHPAKSAIKVIDFGSSCLESEKIYTYIQSRFYRSPEVILGMHYHMAIDMWSLGCILAELYTGFPIFPGENEQEQLACIMEVLGVPDKEFVNKSSRKKLFFESNGNPRIVSNSKGRKRRPGTKSLAQVLRCGDDNFVDFIAKCLIWDPEKRIKPSGALRHPFITGIGRQYKVPGTPKSQATSSSSLIGRKKDILETPKKSLISAPTPLTARSSRTTSGAVPLTPSSSQHASTLGSSSRYRASQPQSLSSYHSARTLNGPQTSTK
ncbi:hypothetical protein CYLTODRAFT_420127 [Cylindrobasidium torrendii FP15055 ss-10]|uniref:dual-specificity kinase n=1 Tax=Cylindrobasidium torrendii FP15055 ss-10 TaxID=1314674 RepID=A0A0D7BHK5_9AGAR|nr:hypothetical protein CYLTODRAFT_420127 [Cylindrobasidium torrendii FP15055 ss-10]